MSTTALKEKASVDWLPHRAQPMEEEESTRTRRVTVAIATQGPVEV